MVTITEIAPDIFRICTYIPEINLQFAMFLVRDQEPLLFHTLTRSMFPAMREAIGTLLDPSKLRWISFSHHEADESGALNEWLAIAPHCEAVCGQLGVMVNINDFALRPARALEKNEVFATGRRRFRYVPTPHLPHGWDAGVLFEESTKTLLCSDLFHQGGDLEAVTDSDVLGRVRETLVAYQSHPVLANYLPYSPLTEQLLGELAALQPQTLATMHGSVYRGDGVTALHDYGKILKEVLGLSFKTAITGS